MRHLSGRYSSSGPYKRGMFEQCSRDSQPSTEAWFCYQSQEVSSDSNAEHPIPGFCHRFTVNDSLSQPGEDRQNYQTLSGHPISKSYISSRDRQYCGQIVVDSSCSISSSDILSQPPTRQDCVITQEQRLRIQCSPHSGVEGGTHLLDPVSSVLEWPQHSPSLPGCHRPNRCIDGRLGCLSEGPEGRGTMDFAGAVESHQHLGVNCSVLCTENSPKRPARSPCSSPDGQFCSNCLYQPQRGNPLQTTCPVSHQDLALVSQAEHLPLSRAHSGFTQRHSRRVIKSLQRQDRVEAQPRDLSPNHDDAEILTTGGPIRNQTECSAADFCILAAGSAGLESGCLASQLEENQGLHLPSICSPSKMPAQNQRRRGNNGSNCASVENSNMVSDVTRTGGGHSNHLAQGIRPASSSSRPPSNTSNDGPYAASRMEVIRGSLRADGISQTVSSTILSSWRKGTNRQFNSSWRKWNSWCLQRDIDPVRASVAKFLDFLQNLFDVGLQYRTINVYRSAISSAHTLVDGAPIGQHHLVSRFFKGILTLRPPRPKYMVTWSVVTVLNFIKSLPDNRRLSLKQLTLKLAMLLALVTASRSSSLTAIHINQMSNRADGSFKFWLANPSKRVSVSKPFHDFDVARFPSCRNLCPVRTLVEYLDRTEHVRGQGSLKLTQLLISHVKPFRPVVPSTISRWLRDIMSLAGIDTSIFKGHSTRSASTSAATLAGVSVADILKAADWSSANTFTAFYNRPSTSSDFGRAVLASSSVL